MEETSLADSVGEISVYMVVLVEIVFIFMNKELKKQGKLLLL